MPPRVTGNLGPPRDGRSPLVVTERPQDHRTDSYRRLGDQNVGSREASSDSDDLIQVAGRRIPRQTYGSVRGGLVLEPGDDVNVEVQAVAGTHRDIMMS